MKTFLVAVVMFTGVACAQETGGNTQQTTPKPGAKESDNGGAVVCRLESVTWNPVRAELTWLVSVWDVEASIEQPAARERYVMHLDNAVMEFNQEGRHFDPVQAKRVRILMDMISAYAVESTVWWEHGGDADSDQPGTAPSGNDGNKMKGNGDDKKENPKAAPNPLPALVRGLVAQASPGPAGSAAASH